MLQRMDDQNPCLSSPSLTGRMSMWPADDSPSRFVTRELECCCMIWSAATENADTGPLMLELVCRCLLCGDTGVCCLMILE